MTTPRLAFITSSRSDFSKIRPYISYFVKRKFPVSVFVTSMHVNKQLGTPREELASYFPQGVQFCWDTHFPQQQPLKASAHLLTAVNQFLQEEKIQFVFVHADRLEALAAALAAVLRSLPVCQIEAGDVSGNLDESFRHAITKLSHRFLVDNATAKKRVLRLGEDPKSVFITGPSALALLPPQAVQRKIAQLYPLPAPYATVLYHPQTGLDSRAQYHQAAQLVKALNRLPLHYVVWPPNNDLGYPEILRAYELFDKNKVLLLPSLNCETYLTLLCRSVCLVGNSSSAVKDAPALGIPAITLGTRQLNREKGLCAPYYKTTDSAQQAAQWVRYFATHPQPRAPLHYSSKQFEKKLERIFTPDFFKPALQKKFYE